MGSKETEKMTLEETFSEVDDILQKLSRDDLPLEESFGLYKDGMDLIKHCGDVIDMVEKQIIILQKEEEAEIEDEL